MAFKRGRLVPDAAARAHAMKLPFGALISPSVFPTPPKVAHWAPKAYSALKLVYLNDRFGDCEVATSAHLVGLQTGNAEGDPVAFSDNEIITAYQGVCPGFDPATDANDNGTDELTMLEYMRNTGIGGHKIVAYAAVDATNEFEVRAAQWLLGNVRFAIGLPDAWVRNEPTGNGFVWGMEGPANPNNGHSFLGVGYNTLGVHFDTWGLIGQMPWDAVKYYPTDGQGGSLYTTFSSDWIAKVTSKAPSGFDTQQLLDYVKAFSPSAVV